MYGTGLAAITGFAGLDFSASPERTGQLAKSSSMGQLALVEFNNDANARAQEVRRHFHDITSDSVGIHTNVVAGGLKRDLSLLFEQTDATYDDASSSFMEALADEDLIYTGAPGAKSTLPLIFKEPISGAVNGDIYGPSWDMLRAYYRLYKAVAGTASTDPLLPMSSVGTFAPGKAWFLAEGGAATEQEGWLRSLGTLNWRMSGSEEPQEVTETYTRMNPGGFKEIQSVNSLESVRATQGAYLPVMSRLTVLYSTVASTAVSGSGYDMDIVVQPFIALHNPYKRAS